MKRFALVVLAVVVLGAGGYVFFSRNTEPPVAAEAADPQVRTLGVSVEGRKIDAYAFGHGDKHLVFVGGIHGGYEWNSVLLAHEFIKHLTTHPEFVPQDIRITVIPNANPDGVFAVVQKEGVFTNADVPKGAGATEPGRFNAHGVDLNRNFDCKWEPKGTWRGKTVSAGDAAFSEPESKIIRDVALTERPDAVIFWHSQSGAVYASECSTGILPETLAIMHAYADAAKYKSVESFDAYEVHGDAEGWLASIGIPAITVELTTHETVEWEKNLAGITALIGRYAQH